VPPLEQSQQPQIIIVYTTQSSFKLPRPLWQPLYSLVGNSVQGAVRLRLLLLLSYQQSLGFKRLYTTSGLQGLHAFGFDRTARFISTFALWTTANIFSLVDQSVQFS
jgi:hypothetical protein